MRLSWHWRWPHWLAGSSGRDRWAGDWRSAPGALELASGLLRQCADLWAGSLVGTVQSARRQPERAEARCWQWLSSHGPVAASLVVLLGSAGVSQHRDHRRRPLLPATLRSERCATSHALDGRTHLVVHAAGHGGRGTAGRIPDGSLWRTDFYPDRFGSGAGRCVVALPGVGASNLGV